MAITQTTSAQPGVLQADMVTVEADLSRGLYSFSIVGLAGKAVDEAKDRVSAAIKNAGFPSAKTQNHKITISLAPADLKKEGPIFDLPIALAYLAAAGEVTLPTRTTAYVGELGLNGAIRPVKGILSIVKEAAACGVEEIIVPAANATEAALIPNIIVTPASDLRAVVTHIDSAHPEHSKLQSQPVTHIDADLADSEVRLEDIRGQESAKRGLLIAAAGRHNQLLVGPPGTGKTMLARAFQGILPALEREEALEVTAIHSVAGTLASHISTRPPFRTPHHTASHTSLVGGGAHPKPGEVTLAHKGVLFLDEFPEFERRSIDALRQPLEDRVVSISRVQGTALFPADFILVAAMNPHRGSEDGGDYMSALLETYKQKISGPILDRIDLWLPVPHVDYDTLMEKRTQTTESETAVARERVSRARTRQRQRFAGRGISSNAEMTARDIAECIQLSATTTELLKTSAQKLHLSPRAYHRVIKVARTIADLDEVEEITTTHLLEALQYRVQI